MRDQSLAINGEERDLRPCGCEGAACFQNCGMFDLAGNDVSGLASGSDCADESQVVGLGTAAGEDDFLRLCADQPRDLCACCFHRRAGDSTFMMLA